MRILLSFLGMVSWLLLEVVLAGLRGELDVDDEGKGRKEPVPDPPEENLELTDCTECGEPTPVEYVFCKACGELL